MRNRNSVFFVGPLPEPVHGFSWVNSQVLARFLLSCEPDVFDRAPPRRFRLGFVGVLIKSAAQFLIFVAKLILKRPKSVYVGWSGGAAMAVDASFVLAARGFGVPIYVHHHSFAYLNAPSRLARMCMRALKHCQNVVLCQHMGVMLSKVHGVPAAQVFALSNAAFLEPVVAQDCVVKNSLRLGFLSNITVEKGILDFFDLAERLQKSGLAVESVIAGPVGEGVKDAFYKRLAESPNLSHVGPVYGAAKDAFYRSLDVLAFPTRYANEAEPVTILEAFRAGVPVIANHRGCIATMIDESSGLGVAQAAKFVDEAAALIAHWVEAPTDLDRYREGARARFAKLQAEHSLRLDWMISRIVSGLPLGDVQ